MDAFEFRKRKGDRADEATEEAAQRVIGAAIEVHRHLGPGLPENSYRETLCHELELRGVVCEREVELPIIYKNKKVGEGRLDIMVEGKLMLGLKVVEVLGPVHRAQLISYLKLTSLQLGLLINFNVAVLKDGIKRVINTKSD